MQALLYLMRKEFRQVFRDRDMLRIIFVVPLVQLFVFSYAASTDLRNVRVGVLDEDRTPESRRVVEAFHRSDVFVPGPAAAAPEELRELLARGKAQITLWIPKGFARDLELGRAPLVAVAVDGQHSNLASQAAGYAQSLLLRETQRLGAGRSGAGAMAPGCSGAGAAAPDPSGAETVPPDLSGAGVVQSVRFFYNPELESRLFMVPGIVVVLITVVSALLTGLAVVREKEIGTLEQLMVTPITPAQLIAGKTLPFAIITFGELVFASTVAILWFDLPLRGSLWLLAGSSAVYLLVTLGIGLLASTLSATQQQAMFTVWFFLVFGILMSGFFYPVENMPRWAAYLSWINPVRFMMNIVRGIFLKGAGLADLWRDLAVLAVMGLVVFPAAVLRFRKRLG